MNTDHWNKFGSLLSSFGEYSQVSLAHLDVKVISFPFLISEILIESKILIRYPFVRYQFNLLKADGFHSDYKKIKILLKHLLLNAFKSSGKFKDAVVNINVACDDYHSNIEIWNSGRSHAPVANSFLSETSIQESPISGLSLIKTAVERLKGKFSISTTPATGPVITVVLPNLLN